MTERQTAYNIPVRYTRTLHRCDLGHTWWVNLRDGVYYQQKQQRFCLECLEYERIEVACVELTTKWYDTPRFCFECERCHETTYFHLMIRPDIFMPVEDFSYDTPARPQWYRLPLRWPDCYHCRRIQGGR